MTKLLRLTRVTLTFLMLAIVLAQFSICSSSAPISSQKGQKVNSIKAIAREINQNPPFTRRTDNSFLTRIGKPILNFLKKIFNRSINIPQYSIGKWNVSLGDLLLIALLTIVVLVIVRFLYKYIMNRLYQKVSDDELLESKSVDDFIKLFIEHKVKGEYGDAVRYLFLAFVKTVMAKGYKYSSNYQLFLHSQKLFPNHKSELREFIKLFEDTRYGNRVCSDEDLNFAQVSFEKFTEQYRFTSTSNSSVVGASQ